MRTILGREGEREKQEEECKENGEEDTKKGGQKKARRGEKDRQREKEGNRKERVRLFFLQVNFIVYFCTLSTVSLRKKNPPFFLF